MKEKIFSLLQAISIFMLFAVSFNAQAQTTQSATSQKGLFESDEVLHITLRGNIRELMTDKADNPKSHPLLLLYKTENGGEDSVAVEARTRGHFRKTMGNCTYPPILLQFAKNESQSAPLFKKQNKLKLGVPCQGEEYMIREWMVYRLYNIITPKSFKARLVSVTLDDTKKKKTTSPFYGILLEEDNQVAKRNNNVLVKKQLRPEQTDTTAFLTMAVFEYLIGNTDWSVQYQNIKLIAQDSLTIPTPVPYDFDQTGLVQPPYAKPAEELRMSSVRERRFRGYCIPNISRFDEVIALYNRLKPDIYKLYSDCTLLDAKYIKSTLQYFDEFYETINNPVAMKKKFSYPCEKNGTGNVVIRGLKGNNPPENQEDQ